MPLERFRCIHVSQLLLDSQLPGTGPQSPEIRNVLEDATLLGLQNVIDACLTHAVDCLLITGNSFDSEDPGLRGQVALVHGLERLNAASIPVFILAGDRDPWSSWLPGLKFPPNVTFVGRDSDTSWPLLRDDHPVAVVHCRQLSATSNEIQTPCFDGQPGANQDGVFSIGMAWGRMEHQKSTQVAGTTATISTSAAAIHCPGYAPGLNYLAIGGGVSRQTVRLPHGIAHDPGPAQGLSFRDAGPRGCSLIERTVDGQITETFLPTAAVRWEHVGLPLNRAQAEGDVREQMHRALEQIERLPADRVWLVTWTVQADAGLPDCVVSGQLPDLRLSAETTSGSHGESLAERHPVVATVAVNMPDAFPHFGEDLAEHRLAMEYSALLNERFSNEVWPPVAPQEGDLLQTGPWDDRLAQWAPRLDQQQVRNEARRLGMHWFVAQESGRT